MVQDNSTRRQHLNGTELYEVGIAPYLKHVRNGTNGQVTALCPFHNDHNPSLSVNVQSAIWQCFACGASGNVVNFYARIKNLSEGEAYTELMKGMSGNRQRIAATYDYVDECGKLLYQVVRLQLKGFRQRRPDGRGEWIWNLNGVRRVPYRLAAIMEAKTVYVVEGEKDADRLWSLGIPTTCNPGGAGKWLDEYAQYLQAKNVVVIPDNDPPGLAHAHHIARSLLPVAAAVKLITLPGVPEKGDISDWLDGGHTKEELAILVKQSPVLTVEDLKENIRAKRHLFHADFQLTPLSELLKEPEERVAWLLDGVLPTDGFSLLAAKPKVGKSTLARNLALAVARGQPFLDRSTTSGAVIYLALEEKRAELRRHFHRMGATGAEQIWIYADSAPVDAIEKVREATERIRPVLIIIDPLFRFTRVRDGNDYAQVTQALEPLLSLARRSGAHVLCCHHTGKGERQGGDAILGSTAIFGSVDTAILLSRTHRYRTLQTIQRYGDDLDEVVLRFDPERGRVSLGKSKEVEERRRIGEAILDFLAGRDEPVTEPEINSQIQGKTKFKRQALRDLVSEGRVTKLGKGGRGKPYKYVVQDSCSLAPAIRVEQENKQVISRLSGSDPTTYSCSRKIADSFNLTFDGYNNTRYEEPMIPPLERGEKQATEEEQTGWQEL